MFHILSYDLASIVHELICDLIALFPIKEANFERSFTYVVLNQLISETTTQHDEVKFPTPC